MNVAILGFGKLGQVLLDTLQNDPAFKTEFQVVALWNRTYEVFQEVTIPSGITVYKQIEDLLPHLSEIDLVIECSHPSILQKYGLDILKASHLFVSSPTAFSDATFYQKVMSLLEQNLHNCYVSLGASIGMWDIIRLDQEKQLKSIEIEMKKHPESFKINDAEARQLLQKAMDTKGETVIAFDSVSVINELAPQNTNTMAVYALVAKELGFSECKGKITADPSLESHIITCQIETQSGLKIQMERDNPAGHGMVTGSATFNSFLSSISNHSKGIKHNHLVFC